MSSGRQLSHLFLDRAPAAFAAANPGQLQQELATLLARARSAASGVDVSEADFLSYIAERLEGVSDPIAGLRALHAPDLYLACACAQGREEALARFEQLFLAHVPEYVRALDGSAAFADEVRTVLREKLLLKEADVQPKIAGYTGRGPLGAWLRVAAIRTGRNLMRARKMHAPLEADSPKAQSSAPDPEIDYLKTRYAREFRDALQSAIDALEPRARAVLRHYFMDGMSVQVVGKLYRVHGSTVSRWIAQSREHVLNETRRLLADRIGIESAEFESLMGLIRSRLDVSIHQVLSDSAN